MGPYLKPMKSHLKHLVQLILCLFSLVSCVKEESKDSIIKNPKYTDPELQKYMLSFQKKMKLAGVNKSMKGQHAVFVKKYDDYSVAKCFPTIKTIHISKFFWDTLSEAGREQLVFHELGHCVLGRRHLNEFHKLDPITGNPVTGELVVSIMHFHLMRDHHYETFYGHYLSELFSSNSPEILELEFSPDEYADE